jgi:hypothetical protein
MEDPGESQETEAAPAAEHSGKLAILKEIGQKTFSGASLLLKKLGLFLLLILIPLALLAYPAYLVASRLLQYSGSSLIEARLVSIDVRTVDIGEEKADFLTPRKHVEAHFLFRDDKGNAYQPMQQMRWPAPGIKRKLAKEYEAGDVYNLYLLPDKQVEMDWVVAKDTFLQLTVLMAAVMGASILMFLLWKRLAQRMPGLMAAFPAATAKSIVVGQLIALLMAVIMTAILYQAPLMVPPAIYLGIYWSLTLLLALLFRLLVFEGPPQPPAVIDDEDDLRTRRSRAIGA